MEARVKHIARRFAHGPACRHCLKNFQERWRLVRHLREAKSDCLQCLMLDRAPMAEEDADLLDQQEAREMSAANRSGKLRPDVVRQVVRLAGPRPPPLTWRAANANATWRAAEP